MKNAKGDKIIGGHSGIFDYLEIKEILIDDFNQFVSGYKYTRDQAIGALLEDSVSIMRNYRDNYVSVIVLLSIISLQNDFIDNFIFERLERIIKKNFEEYKYKLLEEFLIDKEYIDDRLRKNDFIVINNKDYKTRVDVLLGKG